MPRLSFFTLNVWSGFRYNGLIRLEEYEKSEVREERFQGLCREIKAKNPDVIILGEANPLFVYAKRLADELGYSWIGHMGVAGVRAFGFGFPLNLREGDLILAKKELNLTYCGHKKLGGAGFCGNYFSCHFDNLTQAVLGKITVDGKDVYVCGTHWIASPECSKRNITMLSDLCQKWKFDSSEIKKARLRLEKTAEIKLGEAKKLVKWLKKKVPEGAPLIVGGDFNAEAHWDEIKYLTENGFERAEKSDASVKTWDPRFNTNLQRYYIPETRMKQKSLYHQLDALDEMPPRDIDHFFMKNADCPEGCAVCAEKPHKGRSISDHFGLFCTVEI